MLTAIEEWRLEGKVETIDNLLKMNMDWGFIEQATGLNEQAYRQFKEYLAQESANNGDKSNLLRRPNARQL